jgi:hypothetical protein
LFVLTVGKLGNLNSKLLAKRGQNVADDNVSIDGASVTGTQRVADGDGARRCVGNVYEDTNPVTLRVFFERQDNLLLDGKYDWVEQHLLVI